MNYTIDNLNLQTQFKVNGWNVSMINLLTIALRTVCIFILKARAKETVSCRMAHGLETSNQTCATVVQSQSSEDMHLAQYSTDNSTTDFTWGRFASLLRRRQVLFCHMILFFSTVFLCFNHLTLVWCLHETRTRDRYFKFLFLQVCLDLTISASIGGFRNQDLVFTWWKIKVLWTIQVWGTWKRCSLFYLQYITFLQTPRPVAKLTQSLSLFFPSVNWPHGVAWKYRDTIFIHLWFCDQGLSEFS